MAFPWWHIFFHDWHFVKVTKVLQHHGPFVEEQTTTKRLYICCWCGKKKLKTYAAW